MILGIQSVKSRKVFFFMVAMIVFLVGVSWLPSIYPAMQVNATGCDVQFLGADGLPLGSNPQVNKSFKVKVSGCEFNDNPQELNGAEVKFYHGTFDEGGGTNPRVFALSGSQNTEKTTAEIKFPLPMGEDVRMVIQFPNGVVLVDRVFAMEKNNDLPDAGSPYCCDRGEDLHCSGIYGRVSTCSDWYGDCPSGFKCAGGFAVALGGACDIYGNLNKCAEGRCIGTESAAFCLNSCNDLSSPAEKYACMVGRYTFKIEDCADAKDCKCEPEYVLNVSEIAFDPHFTVKCDSECLLASEELGNTICFGSELAECKLGDTKCSSVDVTVVQDGEYGNYTVTSTVSIGCLPRDRTYFLIGSAEGKDDIVLGEFTVSEDAEVALPITVVKPGVVFKNYGTLKVAVKLESNEYCSGEAQIPLPGDDPDDPYNAADPSTSYGVRNCPYTKLSSNGKSVMFQPFPTTLKSSDSVYKEQYEEYSQCAKCIKEQEGTWIGGIGCVVTTAEGIFTFLIRIGLGVVGGIALLRIIYLGIIIGKSTEDAKIKEAWQAVFATLGGVVVVVFSVVILRLIGVNVLDVVPPGFFGL